MRRRQPNVLHAQDTVQYPVYSRFGHGGKGVGNIFYGGQGTFVKLWNRPHELRWAELISGHAFVFAPKASKHGDMKKRGYW